MTINNGQKLNIPLKEIVPEYYSRNPFVRWLFHKRLRIALKLLRQTGAKVIADMGCGDGSFIKIINSCGFNPSEMWGVDVNPAVIDLRNHIQNCHFAVENMLDTNFADSKFDAVSCLDALEHIESAHLAIAELRRILKSKGYLIVSGPVESLFYKALRFILKGTGSPATGPSSGKHYYNIREVDAKIKQMGFERLKLVRVPPFPLLDLFHIALYTKNQPKNS